MKGKDNYFEGFAWAVPAAFSDALGSCHFERGDLLYDTRRAYEGSWNEALPCIRYNLQIKEPLRDTTKADKSEASVFADNWSRTVLLSFTDHKRKETRDVRTNQGRLYSLLWKGDPEILNEAAPPPPAPTLATACLDDLHHAVENLSATVFKAIKGNVLFLMPYDRTQPLLRGKLRRVLDATSHLSRDHNLVRPADVGLAAKSKFAPTARISWFVFTGASEDVVEQALKSALHVPTKDRKSDNDRFRTSAHGHLIKL